MDVATNGGRLTLTSAGIQSRPPLGVSGGGLAGPQLEERFAHGLLLGWRETVLENMPALVPGLGELADEFLVLIHLVQGQPQEGQADGGEDVVLVPVCLVPPFVVMAAVVELDGEHGHPVVISADEEIDVLLTPALPALSGFAQPFRLSKTPPSLGVFG